MGGGGGGGICCPIYSGGGGSTEEGSLHTVYMPWRCQSSPTQQRMLFYPVHADERGAHSFDPIAQTVRGAYPFPSYLAYSPQAQPPVLEQQQQQQLKHQQLIPAPAAAGRWNNRLCAPSLPLKHSRNRAVPTIFSSDKPYFPVYEQREEDVIAALLKKEAELNVRLEDKQRQLRELRRELQQTAAPTQETASELQRLHAHLCDRETELEQLRCELELTKKEKMELEADRIIKDAALLNQRNMPDTSGSSATAKGTANVGQDTLYPSQAIRTLKEKEEENRLLTRRLEALRDERRDLKELLLQKEQQLVATVKCVDSSCQESAALQLGVQAISMVEDAAAVRKQLETHQAELVALREESKRRELLLEDTFRKLNEKRKEAAGLLELVSQRDMKIARVETFLHHKNKECEQLQQQAQIAREQEAARLAKAAEELRILGEQQQALKSIVASRDEKITCLQNELVRRDAIIKQLEERSHALERDFTRSNNQVQQLLRSAAAKDSYMSGLETQLRQNEVQRQASYLAEVSRARQLALETRLKEEECRVALNEKDEALASVQHDLSKSTGTLQQIRQAVSAVDAVDACYRPVKTFGGAFAAVPAPSTAALSAAASRFDAGGAAAVPQHPLLPIGLPQIPLQESLKTINTSFLAEPSRSLLPTTGVAVGSNGTPAMAAVAPRRQQQEQHSARVLLAGPGGTGGGASPAYRLSSSTSTGRAVSASPTARAYRAISGDRIDEAVSDILGEPRYSRWAFSISRISPGVYLVGQQQVQLHLHTSHGLLIQLPESKGNEWMPFSAYLDRLQQQPAAATVALPPLPKSRTATAAENGLSMSGIRTKDSARTGGQKPVMTRSKTMGALKC